MKEEEEEEFDKRYGPKTIHPNNMDHFIIYAHHNFDGLNLEKLQSGDLDKQPKPILKIYFK